MVFAEVHFTINIHTYMGNFNICRFGKQRKLVRKKVNFLRSTCINYHENVQSNIHGFIEENK